MPKATACHRSAIVASLVRIEEELDDELAEIPEPVRAEYLGDVQKAIDARRPTNRPRPRPGLASPAHAAGEVAEILDDHMPRLSEERQAELIRDIERQLEAWKALINKPAV